jgi:hypothetical protein
MNLTVPNQLQNIFFDDELAETVLANCDVAKTPDVLLFED